ncbi:MAG TPA: bluetail domain-containing putative surface protein, partial [Steroidobacter sp.]|nr:bluetail domain-containing putative surface protein [Steroidobacter sp.]
SLFQANGWFEQSGSAATNAAGLFNYGDDTYLIAVGDQAGSGFGSDDYIIKVTGLTGTLDVSDFYQPMYG